MIPRRRSPPRVGSTPRAPGYRFRLPGEPLVPRARLRRRSTSPSADATAAGPWAGRRPRRPRRPPPGPCPRARRRRRRPASRPPRPPASGAAWARASCAPAARAARLAARSRALRRSSVAAAASSATSASTAVADGAARLLDPHEHLLADVADAVADLDQVAVDLRHRVVLGVHVRLDDVDVHLLALAERDALLLDLRPRALLDDREVVERQALGAREVERAAGLLLQRVQHARAVGGEVGGDLRVHADEEGLRAVGALHRRRARAGGARTRSRSSPPT